MQSKCLQCGSEQFVEGRVEVKGQGGFDFRPSKSKLMVLSWPHIDAQACRICGSISLSVDPQKLLSVMKE